MDECQFGCTGDDVAVHNGWFRCTPESRALLAAERAKLADDEARYGPHHPMYGQNMRPGMRPGWLT